MALLGCKFSERFLFVQKKEPLRDFLIHENFLFNGTQMTQMMQMTTEFYFLFVILCITLCTLW